MCRTKKSKKKKTGCDCCEVGGRQQSRHVAPLIHTRRQKSGNNKARGGEAALRQPSANALSPGSCAQVPPLNASTFRISRFPYKTAIVVFPFDVALSANDSSKHFALLWKMVPTWLMLPSCWQDTSSYEQSQLWLTSDVNLGPRASCSRATPLKSASSDKCSGGTGSGVQGQ